MINASGPHPPQEDPELLAGEQRIADGILIQNPAIGCWRRPTRMGSQLAMAEHHVTARDHRAARGECARAPAFGTVALTARSAG